MKPDGLVEHLFESSHSLPSARTTGLRTKQPFASMLGAPSGKRNRVELQTFFSGNFGNNLVDIDFYQSHLERNL